MNIMEKAQKRAIIQIDTEYVFNDIYFGEEGMTKQEAIATNILNQAMNRRSSESRAKRLAA